MTVCVAGVSHECSFPGGGESMAWQCHHGPLARSLQAQPDCPTPSAEQSETLRAFPSEGSWKIFSVFKVPMAAV